MNSNNQARPPHHAEPKVIAIAAVKPVDPQAVFYASAISFLAYLGCLLLF